MSDHRAVVLILWAAGLLSLVALPSLVDEYHLLLATKIAALAIFAMSLDLLVGHAGLVSFGHAAYLGAGAYAGAMIAPEYGPAEVLFSLPLSVGVAALLALVLGAMCLRARGPYFIMATLAFAQMVYFGVNDAPWFGGSDGRLIDSRPVVGLGETVLLDFADPVAFYLLTATALVAVYLLLRRLTKAPFGRAVAGIRVNEDRMRALGYDTYRIKLAAFVLAGALAGLAGWLLAYEAEYVSPALLDWRQSGLVLMMVILGGRGTFYGPALGAATLVLLEEVLADLTPHWMLPLGLIVIVAVLVLPRGLAGLGRRGDHA